MPTMLTLNCDSVHEKCGREGTLVTKQDEILEAAIRVLAVQGFQQTKIRDIAKEAGVADGTIYLYFKNKDELLVRLFEEVMQKVFRILNTALEGVSTPAEKLHCFLRTHLHMVEVEPEAAQIISVVLRQSTAFVKEYKNALFAKYLGVLQKILQEGVDEGVFHSDIDPMIVSRALFGAADELALAWLLSRNKASLEHTSQVISKMVLHGLLRAPVEEVK